MFDLRYLFAGICIYYSLSRHTNALYQLYFRLKKEQKELVKDISRWMINVIRTKATPLGYALFYINTFCKAEQIITSQIRRWSRSHLTGTIKSCPKNSKCLHNSFAVVAFYSIEGGHPRKGLMPPHVLLHNVPEVSNIEGIFIILEQTHLTLQTKDNRISLEVSIGGGCLTDHLQGQLVLLVYRFAASWNACSGFPIILTEDDTSFIFWSRISLAVKPSSRKVNSNSSLLKLLMTSKISGLREMTWVWTVEKRKS